MGTILLVDDPIAARIALRRILERAGCGDSEEPEAGVLHPPQDAAVDTKPSNCPKPTIGRAQLIEHLRREFPDIKIVAVSAGDRDLYGPLAYGSPVLLPTPLAIAQLPRAFETVLRRWH
jgi:DNA-binding NarL/FixJ family response regulator